MADACQLDHMNSPGSRSSVIVALLGPLGTAHSAAAVARLHAVGLLLNTRNHALSQIAEPASHRISELPWPRFGRRFARSQGFRSKRLAVTLSPAGCPGP